MFKGGTFSEKVFDYAVIALFALVFFGGFQAGLLVQAATVGPVEVSVPLSAELSNEEALFARAAQFGSVRVIVGFDVGFQPEGELLSGAQVENQRMAIDIGQDVVLNSLESHEVRNVKRFSYIPYMAMEVDETALDALWRNPNIVSISEDRLLPPLLDESVPRINAPDVWDWYGAGDGFDGTGIAVAILDTGVRSSHEFLDDGKVVSEACYSTNSSSSGSKTVCPNGKQSQTGSGAGKNCSLNWDGCDHGTHVAGIAAGYDSYLGFDGVAKGADIIAIQVFSKFKGSIWCGSSSPCVLSYQSDQMKALERVYKLRDKFNIAAVNLSLGAGKAKSPCDAEPWAKEYKDIIDMLRDAGIATVIASGNDGYSNAISFPACISSSVSVGATTVPPSEKVAGFSNHAYFLDLLAPGVGILSSVPDTTTSYAEFDGTSMAAPHVAGAFALLRQANFDASVNRINKALKNNPGASFSKGGKNPKPRIDVAAALADLGEARPEITSPVPGVDEIDTSSVEFQWDANGASVQKWELWVGTSPGKKDVFDGDVRGSAVTSQSVDCIPLTGDPLYVRLRFKIDGNWWFIDFQYTTATLADPPEITVPSSGAILSDNQVTFNWHTGALCVDAWKLYVGTSQGTRDLYDSGKLPGSTTSHTVKGLLFDGSLFYVRLKYRVAGSWNYIDATYTAVTWNIGITDVDPATGSQLEDETVAFTWSDGGAAVAAVVTKWRLCVGSGKGKNDYFDSGTLSYGILTQTVKKLPFDGRLVYVRLKFKIHGIWERADYQYTAVDTLPKITSPEPGTTLNNYSVTFQWTPETHDVKKWKLYVGSAKGKDDYYNSSTLDKGIHNDTCDVVPTDGRKVYVRLMYKKGSQWKKRDYQYTAVNRVPEIDSPAPGSELDDTSVEFGWLTNNAYIRNYKLWIGSSQGDKDIYDSDTLPGMDTTQRHL
jgi:subtilisin family serine protease